MEMQMEAVLIGVCIGFSIGMGVSQLLVFINQRREQEKWRRNRNKSR